MYLTLCFSAAINTTKMGMDDASTIGNNIYCIVVSIALASGPIFFGFAVNKGWKASERAVYLELGNLMEGGSREEEKEELQLSEEDRDKENSSPSKSVNSELSYYV